MNLEYIGHQKLQALIDEVGMTMPSTRIRLDWLPEGAETFDVKAFVLQQLKTVHATMCENDIHASGPPGASGYPTTNCPYCDYEGTVLGAES